MQNMVSTEQCNMFLCKNSCHTKSSTDILAIVKMNKSPFFLIVVLNPDKLKTETHAMLIHNTLNTGHF